MPACATRLLRENRVGYGAEPTRKFGGVSDRISQTYLRRADKRRLSVLYRYAILRWLHLGLKSRLRFIIASRGVPPATVCSANSRVTKALCRVISKLLKHDLNDEAAVEFIFRDERSTDLKIA